LRAGLLAPAAARRAGHARRPLIILGLRMKPPRLPFLFRLGSALLALAGPSGARAAAPATLREAYHEVFLIGAAVNRDQVSGRDLVAARLLATQFASITPENDLKWASVQPAPDRFDFTGGDLLVDFAAAHGLVPIGHTLVWHQQTPAWVFKGPDGAPASREVLLGRMERHIRAVVGRYRGRLRGWDVVNEALADGAPGLRASPWRDLIGEDFILKAFEYAHAADPDAELYYNDYGLENPRKRESALRLLGGLRAAGVRVDGVGLQGHYGLSAPAAGEIEETIRQFAALGLKVMITELDIDVLPRAWHDDSAEISRRHAAAPELNPFAAGLPAEVQTRLAARYAELFAVFLRHRRDISRVTFWGVGDGGSWLNHWPVRGRTSHPLLFDRAYQPKPAFQAVLQAPSAAR
jgi:endo-1,4-beta-xylanase